ncbi:tRNA (adenosine(37)-N6)-threonylcarbamoyltransferase complex dimerization subunit type 1 TsaB [Salinicoccus carnicancri]|uniref:tRNA (adenosine(37)-N6)-threonylcarbamoyltransferase complex dimerization subunit type 1 TsaB n=1 Tax=Salinicoccus carnicancri TaxID=558170 RepID=UPI0002D5E75E|nr:tRNA (adenosine(37)-N6)-threonylcarbamoyltransferase complex dimerization subunit type 1 TsaB [Salinicoccus carnicancri]
MLSLLIDTSNRPLSVALNRDGFTLAEINTTVKKTHSATVMDYIDKLFKMTELKKNDVHRIIVANGPGSYTGVRIGVTVAKTLAYAFGTELYSVSSLFVVAASSSRKGIVAPLFDARRGNVFGAVYNMKSDSFTEKVAPAHMSLEDLQTELSSYDSSVILLDGQEKVSANLEDFVHTVPRISMVEPFETALEKEDIHSLVPEYLRISEAERNWMEQNKS